MTLSEQLIKLAATHPEVIVLWLYGSQAKGHAGPASDWDLAVAFAQSDGDIRGANQGFSAMLHPL